jgi:hypothetical protein
LSIISIFSRQKLSVSCGLLHDGLPILCDHWLFAYACGNHERFCGGGDVVEMYVSLF